MADDIAVFLGEWDETVSLTEQGRVVVYRKAGGVWNSLKEMDIQLYGSGGIKELRRKTAELLEFLGDVKIFVTGSISGIPYYELEKAGCSMWELSGRPEQFLDYVLEQEEEAVRRHAEEVKGNQLSLGPVEIENGRYYVSLAEIQQNRESVTSKQVLQPFLRKAGFYELEILCKHVPPWLEAEMTAGSLNGQTVNMGNGQFKVVISNKQCVPDE